MRISAFSVCLPFLGLLEAAVLHTESDKLYPTLTEAYNAAKPGDNLKILPGIYKERLVIAKDNITFIGSTYPSLDVSKNNVTITSSVSAADGGNDASATILVTASNFKLYNINVSNTGTASSGHAVAVSITGPNAGFYSSSFQGYQNTVYAHKGSQFFSNCYIEGAVDFVIGITGNAWFQGCTLGVLRKGGWITYQGRTKAEDGGEMVFDKARVKLTQGAEANTKGSVFLGRPWAAFARVIFQNSESGGVVAPAGWEVTGNDVTSTTNILFGEYNNVNPAGPRAALAKSLASPVTIESVLPNYRSWVDGGYMGLSA